MTKRAREIPETYGDRLRRAVYYLPLICAMIILVIALALVIAGQ